MKNDSIFTQANISWAVKSYFSNTASEIKH